MRTDWSATCSPANASLQERVAEAGQCQLLLAATGHPHTAIRATPIGLHAHLHAARPSIFGSATCCRAAQVENGDGSYINMVDVTRFPVAAEMSGAIVRVAAGGMRQLHWHLNIDEWQYIINGTFEVGVFTEPGQSASAVLQPGDLGFAPRGSGHYLKNIGQTMGYVVLIFNDGLFTNVDVGNFLGAFPPSWTAASLNVSGDAAAGIDYSLGGFAPAQLPPTY